MASKGFLVEMDFVHDENSLVKYVRKNGFCLRRDPDFPGYKFHGSSVDEVEVVLLYTSVGPLADVKFAKKLYHLSPRLSIKLEVELRKYLTDNQVVEIEQYLADKQSSKKAKPSSPVHFC